MADGSKDGHTIDPVTGNCARCGETRESFTDNAALPCPPGPHARAIIDLSRVLRGHAWAARWCRERAAEMPCPAPEGEPDRVYFADRAIRSERIADQIRASIAVLTATEQPSPEPSLSLGAAVRRLG